MSGRPPKRAMIVWVLGILLGIAYTLNAYHFNHSNIIGVLLGLAWTGPWIIYAIQVWHQEIVECWLANMREEPYGELIWETPY